MAEVNNRIDKPWGYELIYSPTSKTLCVREGHRLSLQSHPTKETEEWLVVLGFGLLTLGTRLGLLERMIRPLDRVIIPRGAKHRVKSLMGDLVIWETSSCEDITVRYKDDYGRTTNC